MIIDELIDLLDEFFVVLILRDLVELHDKPVIFDECFHLFDVLPSHGSLLLVVLLGFAILLLLLEFVVSQGN